MNDEFNNDDFDPEFELEIRGRPVWYSTCDSNLLVYSGKLFTLHFNTFSCSNGIFHSC